MLIAIVREVSERMAACQLSFVQRLPIDLEKARMQHAGYCRALESLGCKVVSLPEEPGLADAVFVEDVALVLDEVAVMTRPGAASRRGEGASIEPVLAAFRPVLRIEPPGTLDGGDVLRLGRDIHIGLAARSNAEGIAQLQTLLAPYGYRVHAVPTQGCLHLKSAVTQVGIDTLLVQPEWVDASRFGGFRQIEVDPGETHAANALLIGDRVLYPGSFPRTAQRLGDAGIQVSTIDVSELRKAEGATTCCSLVFQHGQAAALRR